MGRRGARGGREKARRGAAREEERQQASVQQTIYSRVSKFQIGEALKAAPTLYATWWVRLFRESPEHVVTETVLVVFIVILLYYIKSPKKRGGGKGSGLTRKEVDELVAEWRPTPLVPDLAPSQQKVVDSMLVVESFQGNSVKLEKSSSPKLNLVSFDFLAMSSKVELKDGARETLDEYGCGSCGPRGFYGSLMPHINIENDVAEFMRTEGAISYSDSASAVSSTIPAFAKRGDLLIIDDGVGEPIRIGADLSRAKVEYFKHNDMNDLERVLKKVLSDDRRLRRDARKQRRFIVTEALFRSFGDLAPLTALLALKQKFKFRLILDETNSFGTLGATGRGLTEHVGVPVTDVDIITISLAYALGSIGGLSIGSIEVVDHQRLSGAGYCFSASAPPFVSRAASEALALLKTNPSMVTRLQDNIRTFGDLVRKECDGLLAVTSDGASAIVHLELAGAAAKASTDRQAEILDAVVKHCFKSDLLITVNKRMITETNQPNGQQPGAPSIRVAMRESFSKKELGFSVATIRAGIDQALK